LQLAYKYLFGRLNRHYQRVASIPARTAKVFAFPPPTAYRVNGEHAALRQFNSGASPCVGVNRTFTAQLRANIPLAIVPFSGDFFIVIPSCPADSLVKIVCIF